MAEAKHDVIPGLECPITHAPFRDPVVAADGHTYERAAIMAWIAAHGRSPLTRERLPMKVVPNFALRQVIDHLYPGQLVELPAPRELAVFRPPAPAVARAEVEVVELPASLAIKGGALLSIGHGSALLLGGFDVGAEASTAAMWLSVDGGRGWQRLADAPWAPRNSFGACVTADGHIVVAGGWSGNPDRYEGENMADVWVLKVDDLRSEDVAARWVCANQRAPWGPRSGLALAATANGALLVGGWADARMNDLWLLDVNRVGEQDPDACWVMVGAAPFSPRYGHSVVSRNDGDILVVGGSTSDVGPSDMDAWMTADGGVTWKLLEPAAAGAGAGPYPRYQGGAALLPGAPDEPLRMLVAARTRGAGPYIHASVDSALSWHGVDVPNEQFAAAAAVHVAGLQNSVLVHVISSSTMRPALVIITLAAAPQ